MAEVSTLVRYDWAQLKADVAHNPTFTDGLLQAARGHFSVGAATYATPKQVRFVLKTGRGVHRAALVAAPAP